MDTAIGFLSGAVTLGYVTIGACFLKFWKRTGDRLFVNFALAFWLFAVNQVLAVALGSGDREVRFEYILRVLGFLLILIAIAGKNVPWPGGRRDAARTQGTDRDRPDAVSRR